MRLIFRHLGNRWRLRRIFKVVKRAGEIQLYTRLIADARIRSKFELPLPGEDQTLDDRLFEAVSNYLSPDPDPQFTIREGYRPNVWQWLHSVSISIDDREMYFRISHWFAVTTGDETKASDIASRCQTLLGKALIPIDDSEIWASWSQFRKRWRVEWRTLRDSKAQLIDLSLQRITSLLPWLSVSMIIAGFLHTYWIYSPFGIPVDQFFSVNDYIANSVEEIHHAVLGLIGYLLGGLYGFRNYKTRTKYEFERTERHHKIHVVVSLLFLCAMMYLWHIELDVTFYVRFVPIYALIIIYDPIQRFTMKYFHNPQFVFFMLIFLFLTLSSLFVNARMRVADIRDGKSGTNFAIETSAKKFTHENSTFIGANTRYIFLQVENSGVEIIPIGTAERIEISEK